MKTTQTQLNKLSKSKSFGEGFGGEAPTKMGKLDAPKRASIRNDAQAYNQYPKTRGNPTVIGAKVGAITKAINKFKK